jgi:hypothetical protein
MISITLFTAIAVFVAEEPAQHFHPLAVLNQRKSM